MINRRFTEFSSVTTALLSSTTVYINLKLKSNWLYRLPWARVAGSARQEPCGHLVWHIQGPVAVGPLQFRAPSEGAYSAWHHYIFIYSLAEICSI